MKMFMIIRVVSNVLHRQILSVFTLPSLSPNAGDLFIFYSLLGEARCSLGPLTLTLYTQYMVCGQNSFSCKVISVLEKFKLIFKYNIVLFIDQLSDVMIMMLYELIIIIFKFIQSIQFSSLRKEIAYYSLQFLLKFIAIYRKSFIKSLSSKYLNILQGWKNIFCLHKGFIK